MADYDTIVVGGGISGLLSALVISKQGKRVLVLEKDNIVGGNCNSYMVMVSRWIRARMPLLISGKGRFAG